MTTIAYLLFKLARVQQRVRPLSPFWLALLFSFALPDHLLTLLRSSGLSTGGNADSIPLFMVSIICISMAIARPKIGINIVSLITILLIGLGNGLLADNSPYLYLPAFLIAMLGLARWAYQKPLKPHHFLDTIRWTVPNSLKTDSWWLDLPSLRLKRLRQLAAAFVFCLLCLFVSISLTPDSKLSPHLLSITKQEPSL